MKLLQHAKIKDLKRKIRSMLERVKGPGADHTLSRRHFFDIYFSLKRPFIVQIGANDGKTHDPLNQYITKYNLPGLLVEPQTDVFESLRATYEDQNNLLFANVAIGETDSEVPFFRIKPELVLSGKEYKASSGSSFYREQIVQNVINRLPPRRNNILKYVSDDPNAYIDEVKVRVLSLPSLLREYHIEKIDLFFTDCQGHDFKILKQFDFEKYTPDIINFEHALFTEEEVRESRELLTAHGYKFFVNVGDTCAYKA